ncbi:hypothetical protein CLV98_10369 [Dyadobacter jejuensis]|uniref:DUF3575 domain-containing protein n=1 Tax=Dyadobacter jejuensis TaxID=1082580 RepID=A0A316ANJ8_9BACT|nr:hypothetical protein [Dyadobacter jejuensis]PWJ58704.1 hypothetical protein CLV98_10369 [Dyadobacter jejuensis]
MIQKTFLAALLAIVSLGDNWAQPNKNETTLKKHFVSSSAFMLFNMAGMEDSPSFYQLNFGYRFTPKDALILEAITWKYHAPLGIPYGPSHGNKEENYPGSVRSIGLGLAYQRFLWKGMFTTVHATPFFQQYYTSEQKKIQNGFQLFTVLRLGYQFKLAKNRIFIEPSVAFTHWPINTNLPEDFETKEDKWSNYFLFEPGLHIGFQF